MNSAELLAAADKIEKAAQEFRDHADKVRSWAFVAALSEMCGGEIADADAERIEAKTREFLTMAGES
jgi:hypothetical protein